VRGCKATFRVKDFADMMSKLRHHRKEKHPTLWAKAIKRGVAKRKAKQ